MHALHCIALCLLLACWLAGWLAGWCRVLEADGVVDEFVVRVYSMVVAVVSSCGGIGEVVPAAEKNILAGSEEGEGIKQLFVVHKGVPLGSKVAFPLQPVLVARQVLLAAERFTYAHDVCVVLHKGGQAGSSRWQLVAKEGHDVEDLLVRYCNGESMVPPGRKGNTHTYTSISSISASTRSYTKHP